MGDRAKFVTVSCPEHHETLVQRLWHFFKTGQGLDFDFPCSGGGRPILAHLLVVDAFMSPLNFANDRTGQTDLERDRSASLDSLLEFMYRGTVSVPEERLSDLLQVAKEFDFKMLVDSIELTVKRHERRCRPRHHGQGRSDVADVVELVMRVGDVPDAAGSSGADVQEESDAESFLPTAKKSVVRKARRRRGVPTTTSVIADTVSGSECSVAAGTTAGNRLPTITQNAAGFQLHLSTKDQVVATPVHRCPTCDKAFLTREALEQHEAEQHGATGQHPVTYCCSLCKFETQLRVTYKAHLFNSHQLNMYGEELRKDLRCDRCDYCCVRPSELRNHVAAKHSTEKPFKCPICPYAAAQRKDLYVHNLRTHLRVRNYGCDMCELKFHNNYALDRHRRTHTGERPYVCEVCGKAYGDLATLKWHAQCHMEGADHRICHICGHLAKRRQYLKAHLINVHKMDAATAAATTTRSRSVKTSTTKSGSLAPPLDLQDRQVMGEEVASHMRPP